MEKVLSNVLELVGQTPMVKLSELADKYKVKANILAKCEFYNPFFSVKDRVALQMIEDAEQEGRLIADATIICPTSGNTGVALAAVCAYKGYKLIVVMPENMSSERWKLMQSFGVEVILTAADKGMSGSIDKAKELAEDTKNSLFLDQFTNESNLKAHKFSTAVEILDETDGNIDAFVCGVGTSGTLTGAGSILKEYNKDLYVVAVEPAGSAVLEGKLAGEHNILGIGAGFVPNFYDKKLVNEVVAVSDEEAETMMYETLKTEGLPVGLSSGAALFAALKLGHREDFADKNIVVILPAGIERDMSKL